MQLWYFVRFAFWICCRKLRRREIQVVHLRWNEHLILFIFINKLRSVISLNYRFYPHAESWHFFWNVKATLHHAAFLNFCFGSSQFNRCCHFIFL
jgi:hypothetical protein